MTYETFDPRDGIPVHRTRFRAVAAILARLSGLDYAPVGAGWPPVYCVECGTRMVAHPEPWHTTDAPETCGDCRAVALIEFLSTPSTDTLGVPA